MAQQTLVKAGAKVKLSEYDPGYHGSDAKDDPKITQKLAADLESMSAIQERLYAEAKQSLLIVLQALDGGGKDGTIRHVMTGLNPQACSVSSFKVPTPEELAHDFLWRAHKTTPEKGHITVFNRSHYEDVLVVRVHKLVPEAVWKARYEQINEFEALLAAAGTRIIKLFLYISKDEQKARLQARLDDPTKHWKISSADFPERRLWDHYMTAYEDMLEKCSTEHAPWHIIPANHKWYRNLVAAEIIERTLRDMNPQWPQPKVDVSKIVLE